MPPQQAFAWNPNIRGAKTEDTVLVRNGAVELLTATPELPTVFTAWGGSEYRSAGVLRLRARPRDSSQPKQP